MTTAALKLKIYAPLTGIDRIDPLEGNSLEEQEQAYIQRGYFEDFKSYVNQTSVTSNLDWRLSEHTASKAISGHVTIAADSDEWMSTRKANPTKRAAIEEKLRAAGVLSSRQHVRGIPEPLSNQERERLATLFGEGTSIEDLIDEDRGDY